MKENRQNVGLNQIQIFSRSIGPIKELRNTCILNQRNQSLNLVPCHSNYSKTVDAMEVVLSNGPGTIEVEFKLLIDFLASTI